MTVVDYQCHWYPESFYELVRGRERYPRVDMVDGKWKLEAAEGVGWSFSPEELSLETYFARLDAAGTDVGVSSPNMLGDVSRLELSEAREITRLLNEETARVQREHPDRFIGLAMLPMQDADAAIETLDEAILELGLRGVCLLANIAGGPVATPRTQPIYRRMEELGVPLVLHPCNTSMTWGLGLPLGVEVGITWMWETAAAALSLILTGTLDACPTLSVLHPHLGGMLPYVLGRVESFMQTWGTINPSVQQRPLREYLTERFYVDVAVKTPGALALAIDAYGLERILFATDFPFIDPVGHVEFLERTCTREQVDAIRRNSMPFPAARTAGAT